MPERTEVISFRKSPPFDLPEIDLKVVNKCPLRLSQQIAKMNRYIRLKGDSCLVQLRSIGAFVVASPHVTLLQILLISHQIKTTSTKLNQSKGSLIEARF